MATQVAQNPRYEAHENPPFWAALGYGFQFSLIASATLLVDSGRGSKGIWKR